MTKLDTPIDFSQTVYAEAETYADVDFWNLKDWKHLDAAGKPHARSARSFAPGNRPQGWHGESFYALVESLLCLPGLLILQGANRGWDFCRTHFNPQGLLTDLVILACYAIFFALALTASFIVGSTFFHKKDE
jgi:hypothetical protein